MAGKDKFAGRKLFTFGIFEYIEVKAVGRDLSCQVRQYRIC